MKEINISPIDTLFVNGSYLMELLFFNQNKINSETIRTVLKKISLACLVTYRTRMPIHKSIFGMGIPVFTFPLTIGKNSTAILDDKENYLLRLVF
ncbi:MAG: hypothetical protein DWQ05_16445 [Calditrichaeota bacterium]|nr:MAG: hypothetical protein DWQ05_16445 [Calditrichota bacterium]